MRIRTGVLLAACSLVLTTVAGAQNLEPSRALKYRLAF